MRSLIFVVVVLTVFCLGFSQQSTQSSNTSTESQTTTTTTVQSSPKTETTSFTTVEVTSNGNNGANGATAEIGTVATKEVIPIPIPAQAVPSIPIAQIPVNATVTETITTQAPVITSNKTATTETFTTTTTVTETPTQQPAAVQAPAQTATTAVAAQTPVQAPAAAQTTVAAQTPTTVATQTLAPVAQTPAQFVAAAPVAETKPAQATQTPQIQPAAAQVQTTAAPAAQAQTPVPSTTEAAPAAQTQTPVPAAPSTPAAIQTPAQATATPTAAPTVAAAANTSTTTTTTTPAGTTTTNTSKIIVTPPQPGSNSPQCPKDFKVGVCPKDFAPVCAYLKNQSSMTFSNNCTACSFGDVVSFVEGTCSSSKTPQAAIPATLPAPVFENDTGSATVQRVKLQTPPPLGVLGQRTTTTAFGDKTTVQVNPLTTCPSGASRYLANCTREYRPVCAVHLNLTKQTYSSSCLACLDGTVVYYKSNSCTSAEIKASSVPATTCPTIILFCPMVYRPVCAYSNDGSTSTQPNNCLACVDKRVFAYRDGECASSPVKSRAQLCGTDPASLLCNLEYREICATLSSNKTTTFKDGCTACKSNETLVSYTVGKCKGRI